MTDKPYPPSGALFERKQGAPQNAPDLSGPLEISKELLKELIEMANRGEPIKMDLAGYRNEHPARGTWIKLYAKKPYVKNAGGTNNGQSRNSKPPF